MIFEEHKAAMVADGDQDTLDLDHSRQKSKVQSTKDWGKLSQSDNEEDDMME